MKDVALPPLPPPLGPEQAGTQAVPVPPPPTQEKAPAPPPVKQRVTHIACPSCGGSLEPLAGLRVVHCPFCETPLLAVGGVGIRRFAVEPKIDGSRAKEITKKWWRRGWNKHRALRRETDSLEAFLCFVPFFRARADIVGYALGTEQRQRTVGSGKKRRTETYEVDVERRVERHFDQTYAAVNVAEWGVGRIDLKGDRLVPFDFEGLSTLGMVFEPTHSEAEIRQAAIQLFRQQSDPSSGLKRTRFRFQESVREQMSVVYYPLWVVRYRFRDRSYQAVVDAEGGELAYGKAPGNDLYRALMLVGTEAAACFIATLLFHGANGNLVGWLIGMVALFVLLGWGWKRFRYGGVVEEGTGRAKGLSHLKLANNLASRFAGGKG